jgi:hypothetical protein
MGRIFLVSIILVELGVIIGKRARQISEQSAMDFVGGLESVQFHAATSYINKN